MEVIKDQNYLPTLLKLLSSAKKSIDILAFSFAIASTGGKINDKSAPFEIARNKVTAKFLDEAEV